CSRGWHHARKLNAHHAQPRHAHPDTLPQWKCLFRRRLSQQSSHVFHQSWSYAGCRPGKLKPAVSSRPSMQFMACTPLPAPPLTRLSRAHITTTRLLCGSVSKPTSQKFEPLRIFGSGYRYTPCRSLTMRMNGSSLYASRYTPQISLSLMGRSSKTCAVVSTPRTISIAVAEKCTVSGVAPLSSCNTSAECRCPVGSKERTAPWRSG